MWEQFIGVRISVLFECGDCFSVWLIGMWCGWLVVGDGRWPLTALAAVRKISGVSAEPTMYIHRRHRQPKMHIHRRRRRPQPPESPPNSQYIFTDSVTETNPMEPELVSSELLFSTIPEWGSLQSPTNPIAGRALVFYPYPNRRLLPPTVFSLRLSDYESDETDDVISLELFNKNSNLLHCCCYVLRCSQCLIRNLVICYYVYLI